MLAGRTVSITFPFVGNSVIQRLGGKEWEGEVMHQTFFLTCENKLGGLHVFLLCMWHKLLDQAAKLREKKK